MTDRVTTWAGAIPQELDVMRNGKYAMIGIAKLAAAMLGTSTVVNGLAAVPTTPAGLTVNVTAGEIYSLINVDSTAQSSLAADTTHQIMKQGISFDIVNLSCPAPGTSGQSINYLIQATYQDSDTDLNVLPYYNASNPTQAWSGPSNSGTPQATTRKGIVVLSAKAGTAATTGSQTTPAADSGYTGLWVVTVANGQTTITAGNIVQATNAPILPADVLHSIQASSLIVGTDTGAANACVVNYTYPVTALADGMVLWFKAKAANTGVTTLNVNGLGTQPVVGGNHSALQGGELAANGKAQVVWNATISAFVLLECTGSAIQIAPATQNQHALQFGQVSGVVGQVRNLAMSVGAPSATATLTADEIIVETTLGGLRYCLSNFSKTINLATTGAGGMDTGSAPTSGYVALYAIYNPTTQTSALLAKNATSAVQTSVYSGANMPAGYTASALISVWATNSSGQFYLGVQRDCQISFPPVIAVNSTTQASSLTAVSISSAVPPNAARCSGLIIVQSSTTANCVAQIASDANASGALTWSNAAATPYTSGYFDIPIGTAQTIYRLATVSTGTISNLIDIAGYTI